MLFFKRLKLYFQGRKAQKAKKLKSASRTEEFWNVQHIYDETYAEPQAIVGWMNVHAYKTENLDTYLCFDCRSFGITVQEYVIRLHHEPNGHCPSWQGWTDYSVIHDFTEVQRHMHGMWFAKGSDWDVGYRFHTTDGRDDTWNITSIWDVYADEDK